MDRLNKDNISWNLIDKYFTDNPNNLVAHHLESYNIFCDSGINKIFHENLHLTSNIGIYLSKYINLQKNL